jgi:transposase-like protein
MGRPSKCSAEVCERAVRQVFDQREAYESEWATICSIGGKMGCTPETLRKWA